MRNRPWIIFGFVLFTALAGEYYLLAYTFPLTDLGMNWRQTALRCIGPAPTGAAPSYEDFAKLHRQRRAAGLPVPPPPTSGGSNGQVPEADAQAHPAQTR